MLDFYLIADEQPNSSANQLSFIGGIEAEEFEEAQTNNLIESHYDYYGKFRWSNEVVKRKIKQLEILKIASLANLLDILKQANASENGLIAFGD